jgi:hypothetical protein
MRHVALMCGVLLFPLSAWAESTLQPKYPPGWDCSAVPAGSQRQGCNRSQLDPPMGSVPETKRVEPKDGIVQQPRSPSQPMVRPPTVPRLPGTIDLGN